MNKNQKKLVKFFLCVWIFLSIILNWNDVSWIFNYRVSSALVHDFLNPYQENSILVSANEQKNPTVIPVVQNKKAYPYTPKGNSIEIPGIGVTAPVIIGRSNSTQEIVKDLDNGVVYYPGSVQPGENGQIVVLGHSAPPNWPKIKYDWVFSDINNLNPGDTLVLNFNNREYTYKVTGKSIIKAGEDIPSSGLNDVNTLTIVSCWPPGTDYKRIEVHGVLQN